MRAVLVTELVHEDGLALLQARPDIRLLKGDPGHIDLTAVEAIGVRVMRLDPAVLAGAPRLRVVAKHGVGTDNIPVADLTRRGVAVTVTAEANVTSVAEHTLMLMLAAAKRLRAYSAHARRGEWAFRDAQAAVELSGRTVLVVGYGRIGRRVAALCRAFGMEVVAYDIADPIPGEGVRMAPDLDAALASADVVTLHVPRTAATIGLFDAARLARMRPGAVLVNCARGGIVDEPALEAALREGRIGAAGLDVFAREPLAAGQSLAQLDSVVATPHSAAMTLEGARAMSVAMARCMLAGLDGTLDAASAVNGVAPRG